MKVADLKYGELYRISDNPRLAGKIGPTPLEEASRLALYVVKKSNYRRAQDQFPDKWKPEALLYLGSKMVYGGVNGDKAKVEKVHHFIRPNGKRLYIYGEHVKHIIPFTESNR